MKLELTTVGENQVLVTRRFRAPPEAVYRAHVESELIQRWMLGPPGWTMPVCINDPRPGGKIRFEWQNGEGHGFYLTGEYISLTPHSRIEHVERMHLPDPTPDNRIVTTFEPDGTGTLLKMLMTVPDSESRRMMLESGMEHGMEDSYQRLKSEILA